MIELLIILVISSSMLVLYLPKIHEVNYNDYLFSSNYYLLQSKALMNKERIDLTDDYDLHIRYPIYFNKEGNVNQAQTIIGNKYNIIVHLGNGYLTYE